MRPPHPLAIVRRCRAATALAGAVVLSLSAGPAAAQTPPPAGFSIEAEGQWVLGASDFEAGLAPYSLFAPTGRNLMLDEGEGWGGALAVGYGWGGGWRALVRVRRLEADDSRGPIVPGLLPFAAGAPFGGTPVGLLDATARVDSKTSFADFLIGKDIAVSGGALEVFGGLTYAAIDRDTLILDGCPCVPIGMILGNDFQGLGPKIGVRGGLPLSGGMQLVGGASVAALFGTSTFKSAAINFGVIDFGFKTDDERVVAALDADVGLAFAIGPGTLTIGYRVDALLDALDTDQRVPAFAVAFGFPRLGDADDDLVAHGPFARFALPLGGAALN